MRLLGQRAKVVSDAHMLGYRGITSNDSGLYTCHECGSQWLRRERTRWWPISVRFSWTGSWLGWWGAEMGADAIEQKVFARFLRVGPVVVRFGYEDEYR